MSISCIAKALFHSAGLSSVAISQQLHALSLSGFMSKRVQIFNAQFVSATEMQYPVKATV